MYLHYCKISLEKSPNQLNYDLISQLQWSDPFSGWAMRNVYTDIIPLTSGFKTVLRRPPCLLQVALLCKDDNRV